MSISSISARQFAALDQEEEDLCVIDVRTLPEIKAAHLARSVNIPLQSLTPARAKDRLARHPKTPDTVYLLCQGGKRALAAAKVLDGQIDANLCVIEGGINALKLTQTPLITAPEQPISIERQVRMVSGTLIIIGTLLGVLVSPYFLILPVIIGAGLLWAGIKDTCLLGRLLAGMPWNR